MISDVQIAELADHPGLAPVLAGWHVAEWGHLYPGWTVEAAVGEFAAMVRPGVIPTTFVAFDGAGWTAAHVLGSVSLLATDDLPGFEHVGPWLASLFVVPAARGRGVGAALVDHAVAAARAMGIERLHLFTDGQERYHLAHGWRPLARAEAGGHPVTVMVRSTSPWGARRAVVTQWWRDPDTAGAYSFLRVGGRPEDRDVLAGPIHPGLWFAGEATWRAHPGTLHGAWWSGERAADRVLAESAGTGPVAVIGAGLAGLAAARRLQAAGRRTVVLEAKDEPGGRARVDHRLGGPVHLGGAWVHGDEGHPLMPFGLEGVTGVWEDTATFVPGHGIVDPAPYRNHVAELEAVIAAAARGLPDGADAPIGSVANRAVGDLARDALERRVLSTWLRGELENLYAAPVGELSLRHGHEPFRLPGRDLMLTSSLGPVIGELAAGLDLRCSTRATAVLRCGPGWQVHLADGGRVDAAQVIVTVPVGALRRGRIAFDPPLPGEVRSSIGRIGAGPVAKAFFTFDDRWWAPLVSFWIADEPPAPFELWVDVSRLSGRPTLCAFAVGEAAIAVEQFDEDALCRTADELLAASGVTPPPP